MPDPLRSSMIRLAASMPKGSSERKALLTVLAGDQEEWVKLYDKLASRQLKTVQVEATGVMGGGTKGLRTFRAGRRTKPRAFSMRGADFIKEGMMVIPVDETTNRSPGAAYRLWKSTKTDTMSGEVTTTISMSIGDMGIMLKGMKP